MRVLTRLFASSALLVLALAALAAATAGRVPTSPHRRPPLRQRQHRRGEHHRRVPPGAAAAAAAAGAPVASQGSLQQTADGRFLLATDQASSQISVLRIRPDGSLVPVNLVASGGVQPVSIAVHGPLVYVANAGAGGNSYSGFVLGPFGHLHPLRGSTIALPDGSQPGDILFNATGTKLAARP